MIEIRRRDALKVLNDSISRVNYALREGFVKAVGADETLHQHILSRLINARTVISVTSSELRIGTKLRFATRLMRILNRHLDRLPEDHTCL